ncbi:hypothetical protein C0Q70_02465 [Pomacea canaliculata]|uniref:Ig-like domain-containing protein n=2 Tax=Pomacea canaliculata TaxID=400727 RepID=A0A2T7PQ04_POMCA|nr:hypothetical protein C0Q70_02465 [Pomacea canaliculata]
MTLTFDLMQGSEASSSALWEANQPPLLCRCRRGQISAWNADFLPWTFVTWSAYWTDPRGAVVPSVPARLFTVNYNQWMTNRLILLDVTNEDSGVYKCEINHKGLHLQRFTIIRVEDIATPMNDPGPQRGDISVRSDPVFPEVRAVRAVSKEDEVEYSSRITKEDNSDEPNGYFFAALDPDNTFMGDDQESEDLATDPRDTSNTARKRSKRSDNGSGDGAGTSDSTNKIFLPISLITSSQSESTHTTTEEQSTSSETPVTSPSTKSEPLTVSSTKTATDYQPPASSTLSDFVTHAASSTMTTTYPQRSSSQTSSASPASDSAGGMTDKSSGKYNPSTKDCQQTTFGSHGLLAFAITLAIAVLLLYALLLVILVPRCCGKRRKQATLTGDAMASPAEENVALMEKKHKKVEPMTSATGLNGEFITAVDLDADQNDDGQKAKDDGAEKKDDKEGDKEKKDDKEESTEKSPESFVSTFLLGRLSSSKPEEGGDAAAVPGGEDDVFAGISGTGSDVKQTSPQSTPGDSTPAKEPQESEKKEEKLEVDKPSTPTDENKTEIKFENEITDSSGREAAGKDEGESQQVQAQQVSDIHVEANKNGNIQDIPLLV